MSDRWDGPNRSNQTAQPGQRPQPQQRAAAAADAGTTSAAPPPLPRGRGTRSFQPLDLGRPGSRLPMADAANKVQMAFWRSVLRYWPKEAGAWDSFWHEALPLLPANRTWDRARIRSIACECDFTPYVSGIFVRVMYDELPHAFSLRFYAPDAVVKSLKADYLRALNQYGTYWHYRSNPKEPFPAVLEPDEAIWFGGYGRWLEPVLQLLGWLQPTDEERALGQRGEAAMLASLESSEAATRAAFAVELPANEAPAAGVADVADVDGEGGMLLPPGIRPASVRLRRPSVALVGPVAAGPVLLPSHALDALDAAPEAAPGAAPMSSAASGIPYSLQPSWATVQAALDTARDRAQQDLDTELDRLVDLRRSLDHIFDATCATPFMPHEWRRNEGRRWATYVVEHYSPTENVALFSQALPANMNREQIMLVLAQARDILTVAVPPREAAVRALVQARYVVCGAFGGGHPGWVRDDTGSEICTRCFLRRSAETSSGGLPPVAPGSAQSDSSGLYAGQSVPAQAVVPLREQPGQAPGRDTDDEHADARWLT